MKLGVDVGNTNTDVVAVDVDGRIVGSAKTATTEDPFVGIAQAIREVLKRLDPSSVTRAMLGTTHSLRAIQNGTGLKRVGAMRISAPAATGITPGAQWPKHLRETVIGAHAIVRGGHEFDGSEIATLDAEAILNFADACVGKVDAIALSAPFSLAFPEHEMRARGLIFSVLGDDFPVTMSHRVGALGLLERENAAILNSALLDVAVDVVDGFRATLISLGIDADIYLTQNDGTLSSVENATTYPVTTLGSGITNSMRGASVLSGLKDALVIDVGASSSVLGMLVDGFPRESVLDNLVGGIRTNFRMPDLYSIPFGGERNADSFTNEIESACEKLTTLDRQLPLIAVGGAAELVPGSLRSVAEVIRPDHFEVANAYGAAIAEVSGNVDLIFRYAYTPREEALERAKRQAINKAIDAGADPVDVRVSVVSEIPLAYIPGDSSRVQVKAVSKLLE